IMALESLKDFATLPIPKPALSFAVTRHDETSVRRKVNLTSITSHNVPGKPLLLIELESLPCTVNKYLIVQTLTGKPI
ncbi:hypothetical protein PSY81_23495, partial [Shigella flexneri]|nr:hypothetical protein [Shigella flexneri]